MARVWIQEPKNNPEHSRSSQQSAPQDQPRSSQQQPRLTQQARNNPAKAPNMTLEFKKKNKARKID